MAAPLLSGPVFFLDTFALRQWDDPNNGGTRIDYDKQAFLDKVHELFKAQGSKLVDGYAPFCKHVFVPNFVGAKLNALRINETNVQQLRSGYTQRRPEELAVLARWFRTADVEVPTAAYLDLILYSREQLVKEYEELPPSARVGQLPQSPWGIISIKQVV